MGRLTSRGIRRHAAVGIAAASAVVAQVLLLSGSDERWIETGERKAESTTWVVSISLANTAFLLLAIALSLGPVRSIRTGRATPRHLPWRRVVGVWSGLMATVHVPLAFEVHIPGWRVWWPFVTKRPTMQEPFPIRTDAFAAAYAVGVLAFSAMLVVMLTSNATSMRRCGAGRWKRIQRIAYPLGGLAVVHVLLTQSFESRGDLQRRLLWVVVAVVLTVRLVSIIKLRATEPGRRDADRAPA